MNDNLPPKSLTQVVERYFRDPDRSVRDGDLRNCQTAKKKILDEFVRVFTGLNLPRDRFKEFSRWAGEFATDAADLDPNKPNWNKGELFRFRDRLGFFLAFFSDRKEAYANALARMLKRGSANEVSAMLRHDGLSSILAANLAGMTPVNATAEVLMNTNCP